MDEIIGDFEALRKTASVPTEECVNSLIFLQRNRLENELAMLFTCMKGPAEFLEERYCVGYGFVVALELTFGDECLQFAAASYNP